MALAGGAVMQRCALIEEGQRGFGRPIGLGEEGSLSSMRRQARAGASKPRVPI